MDYEKFYNHRPRAGWNKRRHLEKQLTQRTKDRARHFAKQVPVYMLLSPEQMQAYLAEHRGPANKLKRQAHEVAFVVACKLKNVRVGAFYHLESKYQHGIIDITKALVMEQMEGEK